MNDKTERDSGIYAVCFIIMFIVTDDDYFSDYPVNFWVASFMVCIFYGTMILQSGVLLYRRECFAGKFK